MQTTIEQSTGMPVDVRRWPSEIPLRVVIFIISILFWVVVIAGSFGLGLIYVVILAFFFFLIQVGLIARLRGTAVKIGPEQFPDLHHTITDYAQRSGMKGEPEAYLMQADGALNAFATKFFRGRFVVLYADLLEACGDDIAARNMIIGHEIGHLRCGHLDWWGLTAPGRLIPFLGSAYSRACEFTCDRWGAALSGSPEGARRGLAILAGGAKYGRQVNLKAYAQQQDNLNTGWVTLARWLSTYPPLSSRVAVLSIDPREAPVSFTHGNLRAWGILLAIILGPVVLVAGVPHLAQRVGVDLQDVLRGVESLIPGESEFGSLTPDYGTDQETPAYGSVDDMPAPTPVPQIADPEHALQARQCFDGDMAACDSLYYSTDVGSPEEDYGNTCGGRIPENALECAGYVSQ